MLPIHSLVLKNRYLLSVPFDFYLLPFYVLFKRTFDWHIRTIHWHIYVYKSSFWHINVIASMIDRHIADIMIDAEMKRSIDYLLSVSSIGDPRRPKQSIIYIVETIACLMGILSHKWAFSITMGMQ